MTESLASCTRPHIVAGCKRYYVQEVVFMTFITAVLDEVMRAPIYTQAKLLSTQPKYGILVHFYALPAL